MGESGIAYWAYMLSQHKIFKELVASGYTTQEIADRILGDLFKTTTESEVTEFRVNGGCAEIIRTFLKPDALNNEYMSLTEIARTQSGQSPSYIIQSWLRSRNTVEFLKIWELEHNPIFDADVCSELIKAMKTPAFTLTPKQWISKTNAVGLISKQGKNGGTLAHPDIVVDFQMWVKPEIRMNLIRVFRKNTAEE